MPEDDILLFFTIFCKAHIWARDDTSGHKMVDYYYLNRDLSRSLILSIKARQFVSIGIFLLLVQYNVLKGICRALYWLNTTTCILLIFLGKHFGSIQFPKVSVPLTFPQIIIYLQDKVSKERSYFIKAHQNLIQQVNYVRRIKMEDLIQSYLMQV